MPRPDPNTAPHKSPYFWLLVVLLTAVSIAYPLTTRSFLPVAGQVAIGLLSFLVIVSIVWFAVRRAQRGQTGLGIRDIGLFVITIILIALAEFLKKHQ